MLSLKKRENIRKGPPDHQMINLLKLLIKRTKRYLMTSTKHERFFNDYNNKYNRIIFFIKYKKLVLNSLVKSKFTFQFSKIPSLKTYEMLKVVFYCVN